MSVVVVATLVPKGECRDDLIISLERTIARVHAEDAGCELYALHEADDRLVFIEKWLDSAALDAHSKSPAFVELMEKLTNQLAAPLEVIVLRPHPAGSADQGAI